MSIEEYGFEIHSSFLDNDLINAIITEIEALDSDYPRHGIRNAEKKLTAVKNLVESDLLLDKAKRYLPGIPEVVRVIIFDKTPDKNWLVTWHQDKTISISDKKDIEGWGPWTLKDGVHHVQPELNVLGKMVTFRIHLDDANESNGCLKVIPKSQNLGILSKNEQDRVVAESEEYICSVKSGDLLVMRPLLLHSSSKGSEPSHRRIIHVEYSSFQLPMGLGWT
ncbi:phytanoyl-CoA dioxygenase family protein [Microbulbifer sp. OS29]|uniref:Phytanoyl-CoA dioxygenase family protein n=1 Tax=Microbulbifer okhotskensis TaxID=2926617 RepID=A0A9X2EMB3_9GAMM|nr:phytanoyl-CoA dioxygenase family protein [Microbulbifer okhotskensis]MCO1334210.1 phytanoyl-CoA dioxygenase family protein [Microbulbifer okhotskensis]